MNFYRQLDSIFALFTLNALILLSFPSTLLSKSMNFVDFYYGSSLSGGLEAQKNSDLMLAPVGIRAGYLKTLKNKQRVAVGGGFDFSAVEVSFGETRKVGRYNGFLLFGDYYYPLSPNFEVFGSLGVVLGGRMITTSLTTGEVNDKDFAHASLSIYEGGIGSRFEFGAKASMSGRKLGAWASKFTFFAKASFGVLSHSFERRLDRISSSKSGTESTEQKGPFKLSSNSLLFSLGVGL